jgi:hypothetical protein
MPRTPSAATRWRAVIDDFQQSGLKHAEFCARRGLSLHTFRKYLYGSRPIAPARARTGFLPIAPPAAPIDVDGPVPEPDALVLVLDGGRRIAVGPGFDAATLRRLVAAVEARA